MYNESNEKSYFFRNLIVKILLVLLFVFLLMWLFPMPNLSPFYDKIFTENMSNMTDAAKAYFTTSRLPEEEGETKKLTLKEMLENKIIVNFTDSNGKECDSEKSYVEVTKKDGEYIFKTNLSCSNKEDYVLEYFGCYNVCKDDSCKKEETENIEDNKETKKVTEYQFFKETKVKYIDKYVCNDGYILNGNKCVKTSEIKDEKNANLKCLDGYNYNSASKKCEKLVKEEIDANLTCPNGYIYATSEKRCIKGNDDAVDATCKYTCSEGTISGTKCILSSTNEVDAKKEYSCEQGTTSETDETKCIINETKEETANKNYSCSKGDRVGTQCKIVTEQKNPDKCSYSNWVCSNKTYKTTKSTSSTTTFTRKFLYKSGLNYVYEECSRKYSCVSGGTTTIVTYVDADVKLSCSKGDLINGVCVINTTREIDANKTYKCETGTLNGTKCIVTSTSETNAVYKCTCPVGKLNSNNKCEITNILYADSTYTCNIGTLSETNETKCIVTTTEKEDPTYYCGNGYTLTNNKCYKTTSKNSIISATPIYKTKTEKSYKWSTSEKLEGWTKTGKTRTINVSITSKK